MIIARSGVLIALLASLCFALGVSIGSEAVNAADALEGKVFVGHTGPAGSTAIDGEDEIIFKNGRFLSTSCNNWGFDSPPYRASVEPDGIHFEAVTKSPRHGQIQWRGVVTGNTLEATYLWTKQRWYWFDAHEERRFKGKLKVD
jgi:hypothetical protein